MSALLLAVVLWGAPGSAWASEPTPPPDSCVALDALGSDPDAVAATLSLLAGRGDTDAASQLIECLTAEPQPLSEEQIENAACSAADDLNRAEKYDEALALIEAFRASNGDRAEKCPDEFEAAEKHATPSTATDFGALWTSFTKGVVDPLAPIAAIVGLSVLGLLAIGRLLALVGGFRDQGSTRGGRRAYWVGGLAFAIGTPVLFVAYGSMLMYGEPSLLRLVEATPDRGPLLGAILTTCAFLLASSFAVAAAVLLGLAFATLQQVSIKLTPKGEGSGLDSTRLMAAVNGMAGTENRGIEFAVGTDITTAASSVADLSSNTVVAAVQSALKAIFGTRPWELIVDNEAGDAASIVISRNGKLVKAKRLRLVADTTLGDLKEPPAADRLAALVAGELISAMRPRYSNEFDPGLYGATDGRSIALQYIATSALAGSRQSRSDALPLLAESVAADPQNRSAVATLANFAYRDPKMHESGSPLSHRAYERMLRDAILDELGGSQRGLAVLSGKWPDSLRDNALLLRLVQTHMAATRNAQAATLNAGASWRSADSAYSADSALAERIRHLHVFLLKRAKGEAESSITYRIRRQSLLIDQFRETGWTPGQKLVEPDGMRTAEQTAWREAAEFAADFPTIGDLIRCEDAALAAVGDFSNDPGVAYSLACYRSTLWWRDRPFPRRNDD